jgi:hypothetical protein
VSVCGSSCPRGTPAVGVIGTADVRREQQTRQSQLQQYSRTWERKQNSKQKKLVRTRARVFVDVDHHAPEPGSRSVARCVGRAASFATVPGSTAPAPARGLGTTQPHNTQDRQGAY